MELTLESYLPFVHSLPALLPRKPSVLLIEDDPGLSRFLVGVLEDSGYRVSAFPTGEDALARWRDKASALEDLVLTDIRLPGVSGLHMLEIMRTEGNTSPSIVMSAFANQASKLEAGFLGACFLEKPFGPIQIVDAVARQLVGNRVTQSLGLQCALCYRSELIVEDRNADATAYCMECLRSGRQLEADGYANLGAG